MAKVRVYELARDLNLTNKVLLEKLDEMGIEVKSHMSSLEEDMVSRIRQVIFGGSTAEVEEVRVQPTVIRRRRKIVPVEAPPEEPAEAAEAAPEAADAAAPAEPAAPEAPAPTPTAEAEPAARVISRPAPTVEEVEADAETPETVEAPTAETAAEAEGEAAAPEPEEAASEPAPEESDSALEAAETPEPAEAQKAPKKVRKPQEQAAKIIKLPTAPVDPATLRDRARPEAPGAAVENDAAASPPSAEDLKRRKRKRKVEDEERNKKFVKKKISYRRKSVVEGADLYDDAPRMRKARKEAKAKAATQKTQITTAKAIKRRIKIDEAILLSDLAKRMGIKANEIIRKLMGMGVMATLNQSLDFETATLVASEFDYEIESASFEEEALLKVEQETDPKQLSGRPPVVTIMGHVDHGKTSLLDVIRKTRVTEMEAGGITQHIGAYSVDTDKGRITFLDTPGHEAFTAMRSRGAKVTDIVILVVAADDGVMPQTIEAINHARASEVPIIVAVNKIDKANANVDRVYRELSENGLTPEDWGGDTICVKVSAKQATGIEDLLDMILLQSEMLELKANPERLATGHVVEAKLDSGRGPVATVLVNEGTLRTGDPIVCGIHHGKVRAMLNDIGVQVGEAGPSEPVEVIGLSGVPVAGDELVALADEKDAKQVSLHRQQKQRTKELAKSNRLSLESLFEKMKEGEVKDLNLIIKTDVDGSMEALRDALVKLSNEEVKINVIHAATGTITESDVSLAAVSDAIIIGFNVRPTPKVQSVAQDENVDMRFYNVIYDVIKEVKDAIVGMMASRFEEHVLGRAEVRQTFHIPKVGTIAGCYVTDGKIERGQMVRLLRDGVINYEGKIVSLKRYKDDAKEVQSGYECGIGIENYNDIKVGDVIECFYMEEIRPELT